MTKRLLQFVGGLIAGAFMAIAPVKAATYSLLYSFTGTFDGQNPGKLNSVAGMLYGASGLTSGLGTIFKMTRAGVIRGVSPLPSGVAPSSGLIDVGGTLYGTSRNFGANGFGAVFAVTLSGEGKVIYSFKGGSDGRYPISSLIWMNGALYGTTQYGGSANCTISIGCGTVYKITPDGTETTVYSFQGGSDGSMPGASLIQEGGMLYGTTTLGGANCTLSEGCGTVFAVTPAGAEKVLHSFAAGSDGWQPTELTVVDGTFYGTTVAGGNVPSYPKGYGTFFSVTKDGAEKVLHSFQGGSDGSFPAAGVVYMNGSFYGTTYTGGGYPKNCGAAGCGTVFTATKAGAERVLHAFRGDTDGIFPQSRMIDVAGTLYGSTTLGGVIPVVGLSPCASGCGTVFSIKP